MNRLIVRLNKTEKNIASAIHVDPKTIDLINIPTLTISIDDISITVPCEQFNKLIDSLYAAKGA